MHDETNPIEAVRARLDGGRKWHKGDVGDYLNGGAVCINGAIGCVVPALQIRPVSDLLGQVIADQYRDRLTAERLLLNVPVPGFNDHPDTTWSDVEVVLDKASVAWGEAHQ